MSLALGAVSAQEDDPCRAELEAITTTAGGMRQSRKQAHAMQGWPEDGKRDPGA